MNVFNRVFFPQKLPEPNEITFKTAVNAVNAQRISRIVKAALFALSSIAATITLVLTEASIIKLPAAIPALLVTLAAGIVFYRLNALDERYLEGLDDQTRSSLAKKELERILLAKEALPPKEVEKSLKDVNRLLGGEIFEKDAIDQILAAQKLAALSETPKSIAEVALEQKTPITLSSASTWHEQGRYGLPSYERCNQVSWSGNPADSLEITYKSEKKV